MVVDPEPVVGATVVVAESVVVDGPVVEASMVVMI
jgi:hypothetical protein